jgi:2-aminoadipate transaminase
MNWHDRFAGRTKHLRRSSVRELLKLVRQPSIISFAGGLPAPELFPLTEIKQAADTVFARRGGAALQYSETEGIPELREWIAARFRTAAFQPRMENVLITTGAQQALDLIGRVLLDEGDRVLVENPTYLALLSAWRPWGVQFICEPCESGGVQAPKLVYSVPNFQNPQGTTLSLDQRAALLNFVHRSDSVLIEDNPYGELRYEGVALPHLYNLDAGAGRVLHIGTFSKTIAPGLRVGWVLGPEPVIEKLAIAKQAVDLHTSTLCQSLLYELIQDGLLERRLPFLQDAYRQRREVMLECLEKSLPPEVSWTRPQGGMFLLLTLPAGLDAAHLLTRALANGVAFVPGEAFHIHGGGNTLRLNFSHPSLDQIREGVKRLAKALEEVRGQSGPQALMPAGAARIKAPAS